MRSFPHRNGRPSVLFNEDDFDYALELQPDDEYRQVAEALPQVLDFDEIELDDTDLLDGSLYQTYNTDSAIPPNDFEELEEFDLEEQESLGSLEANNDEEEMIHPPNVVSKEQFSSRINFLRKQKYWVEKAARRSSIGYNKHFPSSDKEIMDKFLVSMTKGVFVRRHQSHKMAETVKIFSTTGCRLICWEKPKNINSSGDSVGRNISDRGWAEYLAAFCGCGDDLTSFQTQKPKKRDSSLSSSGLISSSDMSHVSSSSNSSTLSYLFNMGFKRNGQFTDLNIIAIHPATREDPTCLGMNGTETLRNTRDTYNQELTFSIIIEDIKHIKGYTTLDIECFSIEDYFTLLKGFKLLQEEAILQKDAESDKVQIKQIIAEKLSNAWDNTKKFLTPSKVTLDPVDQLFAPTYAIDPFRAARVGGGLLPKGAISQHLASPLNSISPVRNNRTSILKGNDKKTALFPVAQFLGWNSAGTQIWARLKMAGLDVKCVYSWDLSRIILKIRCPKWRLEQMAEQMHLKIKTKDGHLKAFRVSRRDSFIPFGANGNIFKSSERQQIIDYILRSKIKDGGAELDNHTELGQYIVQRFPLHMYSRLIEIRHSWVTFWKREAPGEIVESWSPFQVSYRETLERVSESIQYFFENILTQPLDQITQYFGEQIAFYFAFLSFYTRWLILPSILGVILFSIQIQSGTLDHWLCTPFAIFIMVWMCLMLSYWRQRSSILAYRWGVLNYENEETERPQFQGEFMFDDINEEWRKVYPSWKRMFRYMLSTPMTAIAICCTLLLMTSIFYSQNKLYNQYQSNDKLTYSLFFPDLFPKHSSSDSISSDSSDSSSTTNNNSVSFQSFQDPNFWSVTFFYPSLYGIIVACLTFLFNMVATYLNEFENHRTQTSFTNHLIIKVFSFQFVTIFVSLYYYAFFTSNHEQAYLKISITIFSFMTIGQWWSLFLDVFVPSLYHRTLMYRMKSSFAITNRKIYAVLDMISFTNTLRSLQREEDTNSTNPSRPISSTSNTLSKEEMEKQLQKRIHLLNQAKSKCWEEALQSKYNNFNDYTQLIIQISFLVLFSGIFPLIPFLALLNNMIFMRFQAIKICYTRQRPIAQKTSGIGVWNDVLQILSVGGALTNCALFGFVSAPLRDFFLPILGNTGFALMLFAYEQVLLLFKYWLHITIPSVPTVVIRAQIRERKSMTRKSILREREQMNSKKFPPPTGPTTNPRKMSSLFFPIAQLLGRKDSNAETPNPPSRTISPKQTVLSADRSPARQMPMKGVITPPMSSIPLREELLWKNNSIADCVEQHQPHLEDLIEENEEEDIDQEQVEEYQREEEDREYYDNNPYPPQVPSYPSHQPQEMTEDEYDEPYFRSEEEDDDYYSPPEEEYYEQPDYMPQEGYNDTLEVLYSPPEEPYEFEEELFQESLRRQLSKRQSNNNNSRRVSFSDQRLPRSRSVSRSPVQMYDVQMSHSPRQLSERSHSRSRSPVQPLERGRSQSPVQHVVRSRSNSPIQYIERGYSQSPSRRESKCSEVMMNRQHSRKHSISNHNHPDFWDVSFQRESLSPNSPHRPSLSPSSRKNSLSSRPSLSPRNNSLISSSRQQSSRSVTHSSPKQTQQQQVIQTQPQPPQGMSKHVRGLLQVHPWFWKKRKSQSRREVLEGIAPLANRLPPTKATSPSPKKSPAGLIRSSPIKKMSVGSSPQKSLVSKQQSPLTRSESTFKPQTPVSSPSKKYKHNFLPQAESPFSFLDAQTLENQENATHLANITRHEVISPHRQSLSTMKSPMRGNNVLTSPIRSGQRHRTVLPASNQHLSNPFAFVSSPRPAVIDFD